MFLDHRNQLENIVGNALSHAKKQGATQSEVSATIEDGYSVTVRMGTTESVEYHCDQTVGLTVYFGQRKGSVILSSFELPEVYEAVETACRIAKFTQEDSCSGLADAALMAKDLRDLDLYHEWNLSPVDAIETALLCETMAREQDKRIVNSEGASVSTYKGLNVYGNSHGFLGNVADTCHTISCSLISKENDRMERDAYYTTARHPGDLENIDFVASEAVRRTVSRLNARKISTGKMPVIFEADIASSLIGHFLVAIGGGALYRKRSFLLNQLGNPIFPKHIQLYERPHQLNGWGSAMFDSEGVATFDKHFIRDGVLTSYLLGSYSARKLKMQTTANSGGVHNLYISTSDMDLSALLRKMGTGILVTELIGQGVNLVTGDYSRGAVGFWVENGQIQYPISEFTIAGNLRDLYTNLVAVGNDVDRRGNIQTGSILLAEMTVAGN